MREAVTPKRVRRQPGQVVRVDLGQGLRSVALVLEEPLVAFYDRLFRSDDEISLEQIENLPVAFTIMVMNQAITKGVWPVIGRIDIPPALKAKPRFCKRDGMTGKVSVYQEIPELAPHFERPSTKEECERLEAAAVWEAEHVEDRLRDHFAGKPNKWVEQLRAGRSGYARVLTTLIDKF